MVMHMYLHYFPLSLSLRNQLHKNYVISWHPTHLGILCSGDLCSGVHARTIRKRKRAVWVGTRIFDKDSLDTLWRVIQHGRHDKTYCAHDITGPKCISSIPCRVEARHVEFGLYEKIAPRLLHRRKSPWKSITKQSPPAVQSNLAKTWRCRWQC